jgi:hypothetical protein
MRSLTRPHPLGIRSALGVLLLVVAACGGGSDATAPPETTAIPDFVIGDTSTLRTFAVACSTAMAEPVLRAIRFKQANDPLAVVPLPQAIAGTFVWTDSNARFMRDVARTDAPPDGVRIVLPVVDTTSQFLPVLGTQSGLVDVVDSVRTATSVVSRGWIRRLDGSLIATIRASREISGIYTKDTHSAVITRAGVTVRVSDSTTFVTGTTLQDIILDFDIQPQGFHFRQHQGYANTSGARTFQTFIALGGPSRPVPMWLNSPGTVFLMRFTDAAGNQALGNVGDGVMGDLAETPVGGPVSPALRAWMNLFDHIYIFRPPPRYLTGGAAGSVAWVNLGLLP